MPTDSAVAAGAARSTAHHVAGDGIADDKRLGLSAWPSHFTQSSRGSVAIAPTAGDRARVIRDALDDSMQRFVVVPDERSDLAGASRWASDPWHDAVEGRWLQRLQRSQACRHLLAWLSHVEERTSRPAKPVEVDHLYRAPLEWMAACGPRALCTSAQRARSALRHGAWMPRVQAAHYQLFAPSIRYAGASTWDEPRVIHWDAARITGHPYLDLLMQTTSMQLSDRSMRKAVAHACARHGDSIEAFGACIAAAVGYVGLRRRSLPTEGFDTLISEVSEALCRLDPSLAAAISCTPPGASVGKSLQKSSTSNGLGAETPRASQYLDTRW